MPDDKKHDDKKHADEKRHNVPVEGGTDAAPDPLGQPTGPSPPPNPESAPGGDKVG